jgi:hypothetical protein
MFEGTDWIHVAQDRDMWCGHVNTAMAHSDDWKSWFMEKPSDFSLRRKRSTHTHTHTHTDIHSLSLYIYIYIHVYIQYVSCTLFDNFIWCFYILDCWVISLYSQLWSFEGIWSTCSILYTVNYYRTHILNNLK